jgi:hypothetical protein
MEPKCRVEHTVGLLSHGCNGNNGKAIYSTHVLILKPEDSVYPRKVHCQTLQTAQSNQIITKFKPFKCVHFLETFHSTNCTCVFL